MNKEQIRKALDHFENDEYTDAKEIIQQEIRQSRDEFLAGKLELEAQKEVCEMCGKSHLLPFLFATPDQKKKKGGDVYPGGFVKTGPHAMKEETEDFELTVCDECNDYLNEKWEKDVKIQSTGEHAGKSVGQIKKEIENLKGKPGNKEKMGELLFALRSKTGWKKGEGATD